jgi:hypothetical protein
MKDEIAGGSAAESQLRERLARHFTEELSRAETDYRTLREPQWVNIERLQPRRRMKLRLAVEGLAAVVLLVVGLVAYGGARTPAAPGGPTPSASLASGLATTPSTSGGPVASASVVLGSDGIPTQVDGQRVYRVGDQATWQNLSGSFLLAAYATPLVMSCPVWTAQPSAEADLVGQCGGIVLEPSANSNFSGVDISQLLMAAPEGSEALTGWVGGPAIVMRVHTHDAEAAQCVADRRTACESAVVVEAVVWPVVPVEVDGQRVYRAINKASFPTSGSFLLGGPVWKDLGSPCSGPGASEWQALIDLFGFCSSPEIDGLQIAPKSHFDEPKDEIVVARVHVNDSEAAKCPSDYRASCKEAIVVESVVWRSS